MHALIGPNGSGKTTLLNVASGFTRPDAGTVHIDGELAPRSPYRRARAGRARTFRTPLVFDGVRCVDNVITALDSRRGLGTWQAAVRTPGFRRREKALHAEAVELLAAVGAQDSDPRLLSPGGRRRLELARVLAVSPSVLLLDEPAAGLSPTDIDQLVVVIGRLRDAGMAIVIVEHHIEMVMNLADEITVLERGEVIATGKPEDVRRNPVVLAAYLGPRHAMEQT